MPDLTSDPAVARSASRELLHDGDAEAFVAALASDALAHPALAHVYLARLASGDLPDVRWAIGDFCHQYRAYSDAFPAYLEAVLARLPLERHRERIRCNLDEERGLDHAGPDAAAGTHAVPHTVLFDRLRRACCTAPEHDAATPPCAAAVHWRDAFLRTCESEHPGVGLGAIGIGTELIVSTVYRHLHTAVTRHTDVSADDYLFLTLHIDCDDDHGDQMRRISVELAEDVDQRGALRFGVFAALGLRHAFWDAMLERATERATKRVTER